MKFLKIFTQVFQKVHFVDRLCVERKAKTHKSYVLKNPRARVDKA